MPPPPLPPPSKLRPIPATREGVACVQVCHACPEPFRMCAYRVRMYRPMPGTRRGGRLRVGVPWVFLVCTLGVPRVYICGSDPRRFRKDRHPRSGAALAAFAWTHARDTSVHVRDKSVHVGDTSVHVRDPRVVAGLGAMPARSTTCLPQHAITLVLIFVFGAGGGAGLPALPGVAVAGCCRRILGAQLVRG